MRGNEEVRVGTTGPGTINRLLTALLHDPSSQHKINFMGEAEEANNRYD
jgi:hypothetical protein